MKVVSSVLSLSRVGLNPYDLKIGRQATYGEGVKASQPFSGCSRGVWKGLYRGLTLNSEAGGFEVKLGACSVNLCACAGLYQR
jgi:hypothetical protein